MKAACESVNSHMLAPLYNLQAYKMASLLLAPIILPIEVSYILIKRLVVPMIYRDRNINLLRIDLLYNPIYSIIDFTPQFIRSPLLSLDSICDRSNLRSVDMSWCLGELSIIARELYDIIQNNRHRYSARLDCQVHL